MKHSVYVDGQTVTKKIGTDGTIIIKLSSVGSQPSKVSATWTIANGKKGVAFGGFQDSKDFDFQTAAALAIENAISQAEVA